MNQHTPLVTLLSATSVALAGLLYQQRKQYAELRTHYETLRQVLEHPTTGFPAPPSFANLVRRSVALATRHEIPFLLLTVRAHPQHPARPNDSGFRRVAQKTIASRLVQSFRQSDLIAHLHDYVFAVLAFFCDARATPQLATRVPSVLNRPVMYRGQPYNVTVDTYTYTFPDDDKPIDTFFEFLESKLPVRFSATPASPFVCL